jgi:phenylalanyl-tRNA synthetase beta chain
MFKQMLAPFEPQRSAVVYHGKGPVGVVGEFKSSVRKNLKLPEYSAGFELFLTPLARLLEQTYVYTQLSRYPKSEQDITLRVENKVTYLSLEAVVKDVLFSQENTISSVKPVSIYQKNADDSHKQVTFRVAMSSYIKTLRTEEVTALLDAVAARAKEDFGAERI